MVRTENIKGDQEKIYLNVAKKREKGGGHASNPLQLRIVSMFYGEPSRSPEVAFEACLKP